MQHQHNYLCVIRHHLTSFNTPLHPPHPLLPCLQQCLLSKGVQQHKIVFLSIIAAPEGIHQVSFLTANQRGGEGGEWQSRSTEWLCTHIEHRAAAEQVRVQSDCSGGMLG